MADEPTPFGGLFGDKDVLEVDAAATSQPAEKEEVTPAQAWAKASHAPWVGWTIDTTFLFEHWFPMIKDLTFRSEVFPLSTGEVESLHNSSVFLNFAAVDVVRQRIDQSPALQHLVLKFDTYINRVVEDTKKEGIACSGAFVKLSTRSPKDAALYDHAKTRHLIREESTRYHSLHPFKDEDTVEQIAQANYEIYSRLAWRGLLVATLLSTAANQFGTSRPFWVTSWLTYLPFQVVRAWEDIEPEWEFRVFVQNGRLTAATQYYEVRLLVLLSSALLLTLSLGSGEKTIYVPEMYQRRAEIKQKIVAYWAETVRPLVKLPNETYTVDLVFDPKKGTFKIIELNDPPPIAGTSLFNWEDPQDQHAILHNADVELRVLEKSKLTAASIKEEIPHSVWSFMMNCRDKLITKGKC